MTDKKRFRNTAPVIGFSLVMLAFVTGCRSSEPSTAVAGEIVSCESLKVNTLTTPVLELPCLYDQSPVDVGAVKGPILINVWGSWCAPCIAETPILRSFYDKYSSQVALLGVDIEEESATSGQDFIESNGIIWPQVVDQRSSIRKLSGMGVPTTLFVDQNGTILKTFVGPFSSLEQVVAEASQVFGLTLEAK